MKTNEHATKKDYDDVIGMLMPRQFPRLIRLSDLLNRYIDIRFRGKIDWLKINALMTITLRRSNLNLSELSALLIRPKWTITKLVDSMEKDGLVVRLKLKNDRRSFGIQITKRGLKELQDALAFMDMADEEIIHSLSEDDINGFGNIIRILIMRLVEVTGNYRTSYFYYHRAVFYQDIHRNEAAILNFKKALQVTKDKVLLKKIKHEIEELTGNSK